MIEVRSLYKSFGDKVVLSDVFARFEPARTSLIIGASGSGKTVLMKCMVGLIEPDKGQVIYDGASDLIALPETERRRIRQQIGMLFQGSALFDSMNVEENVMFPLTMFTKMTYKEKLHRVNECLERVNLSHTNRLMPSELSGGMKKRVGIARAIVMNPRYLFCDEPNSGLDPQTAIRIDELIREITLEYRITTIINTHDLNSVIGIGDYIVFLFQGKKEWEGDRYSVLRSDNQALNDFVFASRYFKEIRDQLVG
ncbi:MAG: ATP-binding cassette domain-containing protein [Chitinophagales bacterium]|nr:ATP-binding cassette domain-containing protein [Chitinophagales bacterium]MDW8393511.1 ATP-binding cassette domain-containing protein [Chitinophagales bacterium]